MEEFTKRHGDVIIGIVEGFDRVLFRGTLRGISYVNGLKKFLAARHILWKDFPGFAQGLTAQLTAHLDQVIAASGRPHQYLASPGQSKEQWVEALLQRDPVAEGLVCTLTCVEPCQAFDLYRNRAKKCIEVVSRIRKCKFYYFYYQHPRLGLMHVRLQSWLPFDVQVCINGRSYLQCELDRLGVRYRKADNCFLEIADLPRAQRALDKLAGWNWPAVLDGLLQPLMVLLKPGQGLQDQWGYYWTIRQSEYATDIMFRDAAALAERYPALCQHAITCFRSPDVLRFLGRAYAGSATEVTSALKRRVEGVRVKHWVGKNSLKMYDKHGSVLRVEMTMNDPRMFRVYRRPEGGQEGPCKWLPLRKGTADTPRRVEVSRAANLRYLEALAVVGLPQPAHQALDPVTRRVTQAGQSYRALRPISPEDAALFAAILRGEHLMEGFTNAAVQAGLFSRPPADRGAARRRSRYVTHRLKLLRKHGLIQKIPGRRRYKITPKGSLVMSLSHLIRHADQTKLAA
jgi:hypothetical protein